MRLVYEKVCNGSKLLDELIKAGIVMQQDIAPVQVGEGVTYVFVPDDTQKSQIDIIIANHDPTPLPQPPTLEERLTAIETAMLEMILGGVAFGSVFGDTGSAGQDNS